MNPTTAAVTATGTTGHTVVTAVASSTAAAAVAASAQDSAETSSTAAAAVAGSAQDSAVTSSSAEDSEEVSVAEAEGMDVAPTTTSAKLTDREHEDRDPRQNHLMDMPTP